MRFVVAILLLPIFTFAQKTYKFRPDSATQRTLESRRYKHFKFSPSQQEIIDKCHTAKNESYLDDLEKEFILLHNLARTNIEFFKLYVSCQYDSAYLSKIPNIQQVSRNLLMPDKGLHKSAKVHAIKSGKKGTTGHQNLDKRIGRYNYFLVKKSNRYYGENCSYGNETAMEYFMGLLNSSGHRKNILTPEYNSIGVSLQPHIKYGNSIVACFARK